MGLTFDKSRAAYEEAKNVIPGGVNSPVRAFNTVGEHPIFIERAKGSRLFDIDGNEFIDYVCSWGPLILGHCYESVQDAVRLAVEKGTTFGMPTVIETKMAEKICQLVPSVEMVRMVSSGTEATMSALRLARGYTNRNKIIKFQGCYHGHADHLLIQAGSGAMTFGVPSSPGVPEAIARETLTAGYNDIASVRKLFEEYPDDIAAVIVEPVPGNMGLVPPKIEFLQGLRALTKEYNALLIFDEVISGFRASLGGAQKYFDIMPDLTCLGKIIGGGLPVGAFGGKKEIMEHLAPVGSVYQAGTLSGNPCAMAAGYTMLCELEKLNPYADLSMKAEKLADAFRSSAKKHGVDVQVNQFGSLLTIFFTSDPVDSYEAAQKADTKKFAVFFDAMLKQGIHLPPSQFECMFLSAAHTDDDLEKTIEAADKAFAKMGSVQ